MQTTGRSSGGGTDQAPWQAPLEADAADAADQARGLQDDDLDPEAPAGAAPGAAAFDLGLGTASEADLAEQLSEVAFDDDGDR